MPQATERPADGPHPAEVAVLDGVILSSLLEAGTLWLERNAARLNALNVFPVPDGDTGTNMLLTMRSAVQAARQLAEQGAGSVMRAAAQGALMGARGNSGVILSQILAGIARELDEHPLSDGATLARALAEGAASGYRAVGQPVEGTILTVARAAGAAAVAAASGRHGSKAGCRLVLERAAEAAARAVAQTPDQLPLLRQAGVVDAGGEGYRLLLEGMVYALRGEPLPQLGPEEAPPPGVVEATTLPATLPAQPATEWGYCTQFLIRGTGLDLQRVRADVQELAASALVVGDDEAILVHGHTDDPGALLTYARRLGRLQRISIEDMDAQHDAWLRSQAAAAEGRPPAELATVAVVSGEGLAEVFRSLGVTELVRGGQTMNPSAQDLLQAARRTAARQVLLLPNNANVVPAAQQAAALAAGEGRQLLVVPARTIPQGVAALLAFNPEAGAEENRVAMEAAAAAVRTVEITRATRSAAYDGLQVAAGDYLALVDGRLVASTPDVLEAVRRGLAEACAAHAELLTFYRGAAISEEAAASLAAAVREDYPAAQVEVVAGGQPHYDYIISVE
jgi:DAK2 domain fusion protein YloV